MDLKRIDELANGVDWYLKQISNFTEELKQLKAILLEQKRIQERNQQHEIRRLSDHVAALTEMLKMQGHDVPNQYEIDLEQIRNLMEEGNWPLAVPPERICNSGDRQQERANGIIKLFVSEYLKDKRFLDFGCGGGHCVTAAMDNEAAFAIGYDIKNKGEIYANLTDDWNLIEESAPYDVILLHDVLDHIEMYDPIEAMKKVKSVLSPGGHVYVRNHPWSSRHGGHLYLHKNLAFLHLIFDEVELARVGGLEAEYNIKVFTPLETYRYWFKEAGFKVDSEMPIRTPVEDFFKESITLYDRLVKLWPEGEDPYEHMQIDFVEYSLSDGILDHQII